jgi:hypothetical protein
MWEQIIASALHIAELAMEGQTPAQAAEFWQMYLDDIKELRAFIREHRLVVEPPKAIKRDKRNGK